MVQIYSMCSQCTLAITCLCVTLDNLTDEITLRPTAESLSHLRAYSRQEKHSSSGIKEILKGWRLTVQLGNSVVDIDTVQRSQHTLNRTREGGALLSGL